MSADGCSIRRGILALPFSQLDKKIKKPLDIRYITNPTTIGEHIRNKRIEERLFQKDVAKLLGVSTNTVTNWENNKYLPSKNLRPNILKFILHKPHKLDSAICPENFIKSSNNS